MRRFALAVLAMVCLGLAGPGRGAPAAAPPPMEKQILFGPESAREWTQAESTLEAAPAPGEAGKGSLRWHIPVDHTAGEKAYPIGWPRINHAIPEGRRDWSAWDFLHFRVYTETSREALPRVPVSLILHAPDKAGSYTRSLEGLRKGEWVDVTLPISAIPRAGDVRLIQFSISESSYRHGDTVDFTIDDLALLRYAEPTVLQFAPENAIVFTDARSLPVRCAVSGIPEGARVSLSCELQQAGRTVSGASATVSRGEQRIILNLGAKGVPPGSYSLVARVAGGNRGATAPLRVVESPFAR